jgi:GNAT acetyltransferase-like protein
LPPASSTANSIFQEPWWLDAVAPGQWEEATVARDGRVVARLPYVMHGRPGLRVMGHPPLTPRLGPWIEPSAGKYESALRREMQLMGELIEALPEHSAFHQLFSPTVSNGLPFHWAGYGLSVRYTYRLHDIGREEELWNGLSGKIRTQVRKAQQALTIRTDLGIDRLHSLWSQTFERQGMGAPEPQSLLERIEAACAARGAREILFAQDEQDRVHAAAYVVLDANGAYYLLGGADPALRNSDATSLLVWEAIRRSAGATDVFDFEGSMLRSIERFFRAFGARQTPYLAVSRYTRRLKLAHALRRTWSRTS